MTRKILASSLSLFYHMAKIGSGGKVTDGDLLDAKDIYNPMKSVDEALTQVDSLSSSLGVYKTVLLPLSIS